MKLKKLSLCYFSQYILAGMLSTLPLLAQAEQVMLNFANADLEATTKAIGILTHKNFVLDPRAKGTINIVSAKPVASSEVFAIFQSALRLQGFTIIESGNILQIVPEADAKQRYSPTLNQSNAQLKKAGNKMVTQVYALRYESATQIVPILRPLISPNNTINAYAGSNTLVITDYADNILRLNQIIANLDKPSSSEFVTLALKNGSALDMAQLLSRLLPDVSTTVNLNTPSYNTGVLAGNGSGNDGIKRSVVLPDMRTNSLIIRAESASQLMQIRNLVQSLDVPISGAGNIRVVYLKNAEAIKLVQTLRNVLNGESSNNTATTPSTASSTSINSVSVGNNANIQADPATNSLVINAPEPVYNNLRAIIEKLDVRRAQVYVEALIVEVNADKAAELGVQWQDLTGVSDNKLGVIGGTNFSNSNTTGSTNIISVAQNPTSLAPGLNLGLIKGLITYNGTQLLNLGMLARALEGNSNVNILSTPSLLTLDNEEAKIIIGRNVPFVTGQYTNSGSSVSSPFQTIERKDVGLSLKVKPQISESGTVKLNIMQEVSKVDRNAANAAGLETSKRSIESTILVDDGQTIVLGGLIEDDTSETISQVPILGDLPIIGGLFRSKARTARKTNLMVFLRPVVLRDENASQTLTADRYEYLRKQQQNFSLPAGWIMPAMQTPVLPENSRGEKGKALMSSPNSNKKSTPKNPKGTP